MKQEDIKRRDRKCEKRSQGMRQSKDMDWHRQGEYSGETLKHLPG